MGKRQQFQALILSLPVLTLILSGCNSSLKEICETRLAPFQAELAEARQEFSTGRALASHGKTPLVSSRGRAQIDPERKEYWREWAEDQLRETQFYLELTEQYPQHREDRWHITQLANHVVAFYGYIEQGNVKGAGESLRAIGKYSSDVESTFCRGSES